MILPSSIWHPLGLHDHPGARQAAVAAPRTIPVAWCNALESLVVVARHFSSFLGRARPRMRSRSLYLYLVLLISYCHDLEPALARASRVVYPQHSELGPASRLASHALPWAPQAAASRTGTPRRRTSGSRRPQVRQPAGHHGSTGGGGHDGARRAG